MENGKIGVISTSKPVNQLAQNLTWVITSMMSLYMPRTTMITPVQALQQIGEILLSHNL